VRTVQGANGPVFRVQVGTEHDRGHAEETLRQIEKNTGINGIITTHH
jgi:cell division septation protein DedD